MKTVYQTNHFLDYMATQPPASTRFYASDMILNVHSNTSYLTASRTRSRAGGCYFLGKQPRENHPIFLNGPIHVKCCVLKSAAASAAEAKLGALFLNAKEAKVLRLTLEELGYPQPPTHIHVNNTTVTGIVNNSIKRQRSMEMRYFGYSITSCNKYFDLSIILAPKN